MLTINASTFLNNAGFYGGAVCLGAPSGSTGTAEISNSTFTGNNASIGGGGAIEFNDAGTVVNCTIVNNIADVTQGDPLSGGGIQTFNTSPVAIYNSIVAGNQASVGGVNQDDQMAGTFGGDYDIFGLGSHGTAAAGSGVHSQTAVANVQLSPIGRYGGNTETYVPWLMPV